MKNRSQASFVQLIQDHRAIIWSLCRVFYQQREDIHDAKQDIILQLWRSYQDFRGDSRAGTWIYKVALNTLLTKKRKEKRNTKVSPLNENIRSKPLGLDDERQYLLHLFQRLKDLDKAIVLLYLEGYNHEEIGQLLKLSRTNVGTRISRIKEKLRSWHKSHQNETK